MRTHVQRSAVVLGISIASLLGSAATGQIIPVSQQRHVTADSIVSAPTEQDIDFASDGDFNRFKAQAVSGIANTGAAVETAAAQVSSIDECGVIAVGTATAIGDTSGDGFHGYSVGATSCQVVFDITRKTEFLVAGTLDVGEHGQSSVSLTAFPSQLVFLRTTQDGALGVHKRITLGPGRYTITYSGLATVAANNGADMNDTAAFNLTFTHCFVPADLNVDGTVGVADLLGVIGAWGACPDDPLPCAADVDLNGAAGIADLLAVIAAWGTTAK